MSRGPSIEVVSVCANSDLVDDMLDPSDRPYDVDPCTSYRHGKLRGNQRCYGCGRTRNEVEIEEGVGHA